jgi:hypothetical protein
MLSTEELRSKAIVSTSGLPQNSAPHGPTAAVEEMPLIAVDTLSDREEWHLACRIASSRRLSKSDRLPRFLLYICEQTLTGNSNSITEQRLGTHIFNRPTDYNPGEDNIVRSYARMLRKRLDEYFESEGSQEPIRIVIPRGGYVPTFLPNVGMCHAGTSELHPAPAKAVPAISTADIGPQPSWKQTKAEGAKPIPRRSLIWITGLICLLVGCVLGSVVWWATHSQDDGETQEPAHPIWAELFQKNRSTLIVPADSGLGILQNLTGRLIPLESYANGSYFSGEKLLPGIDAGSLADLREQRYTSVVDLNVTASLMQLRELSAGRVDIRYARSITAEDLKSSNVILLGSNHTNPWVSLFEDRMNFKMQYSSTVDQSLVLNERPSGTEQKQYLNGTGPMANRTYGLIDYLPNLDGSGHVLIIQGLNMAATQAAADVLFHSPEIRSLLNQARLPNGALRSFELLIQTSSIGATDPGAQIIATRFYS